MDLIIRTDSSTTIGSGHVMRCLALAQACHEAGRKVVFATAMASDSMKARLRSEEMSVAQIVVEPGSAEDALQTVDIATQKGAKWVVVDGYHFGASYQQALKNAGLRVLFIDDYGHAKHYSADIVLNQNINVDESLYSSRESYTRLLLGTNYVLLRKEFWPWRDWKRQTQPQARKVLVTMGGSDPNNVTYKVLRALQCIHVKDTEVKIVLGNDNPHYEMLGSFIRNLDCNIKLETSVVDMSKLMAWADIAITSGGSTCWEVAYMGLPGIAIALAENQRGTVKSLDALGVLHNINEAELAHPDRVANMIQEVMIDSSALSSMSQKGRFLVNGSGAKTVASQLVQIS